MVYTKTINDSMIINFDYVYHHLLSRINVLRDRPINLKRGGGYGFLFRSEFFFRTTQELEYLFFLQRIARIFFPASNICYMTKTLNQIIFFRKKNITLILKRDKRKSIYVLIHQFKRT